MVERYEFTCLDCDPETVKVNLGRWVRYSDYEAVQQELAEARAERDDAVATVKLLTEQHRIQVDHDGRLIDAAEALARQQAEEIGKLQGLLGEAREYVEIYDTRAHNTEQDKLLIRIDAALSKEEQP